MKADLQLLSLHRYYIFSNRLREHFESTLLSCRAPDEPALQAALRFAISDPTIFMFYWYASLNVVIEGWRTLRLRDTDIDALLTSPNVRLLRRFRHGVFHFQKKYGDDRFTDLLQPGEQVVPWVRDLHAKLGAYFLREIS